MLLVEIIIILLVTKIRVVDLNVVADKNRCLVSKDCGWCGYCLQGYQGTKYCYYPYTNSVHNFNTKCLRISFCLEAKVCKNNGKCTDGFGYQIATCFCNINKYYGEFCQHEIPKELRLKLATGFGVFFSEVAKDQVSFMSTYQIKMFVTTKYSGEELSIHVSTNEGFEVVIRQSESCQNQNFRLVPYKPEAYCRMSSRECQFHSLPKDCKDLYSANLDFPYHPFSGDLLTVIENSGNSAVGYLTQINVEAKNFQTTVFTHTFDIMVNFNYLDYRDLSEVPKINIRQCAKFSKFSSKHFRSVAIRWNCFISGNYDLLEWAVYLMPQLKPVDTAHFTVDNSGWTIPPFQLIANKYKIRLFVVNVETLSNFLDCYFEIQSQPLVARLEGGNRRVVGIGEGVFISGGMSVDPNEPLEKQDHLSFLWTCSPKCSDIIESHGHVMRVRSEKLAVGKLYTFTLTVSAPGLDSASDSQEILVVDKEFGMSLYCVANCRKKIIPTEVLLLQVKPIQSAKINLNLIWRYIVLSESDETMHSVDGICDNSYPPDLLFIKPDSLVPGKSYQFEVSNEKLKASTQIAVDNKPQNGTCTVSPLKGVLEKTLFTITCSGFVHDDNVLVYEYYNKYKFETGENFNGRMLGADFDGTLTDVILTREVVVIFIYSLYGYPTISTHEIILDKEYVPTLDNIELNLTEINSIAQSGNFDEAMRQLSGIMDILPNNDNKNLVFKKTIDILKTLLQTEQGIKTAVFQVKNGLLTVRNILYTLFSKGYFDLQPSSLKYLMGFVQWLSGSFKSHVIGSTIPCINKILLKDMVQYLIDILESFVTAEYDTTLSLNKMSELNPEMFKDIVEIGVSCNDALNDILYAVSFSQNKYLKSLYLESNSTKSWLTVLTDSPHEAISRVNKDDKFVITLPIQLINELRVEDSLTILSTSLAINPSFIHLEIGHLSTNLVGVELFSKMEQSLINKVSINPIDFLPRPIDLYLDVKITYERGSIQLSTTQLDLESNDKKDFDNFIKIIRIDVPSRCKMFIEFKLNDSLDELRVNIQWGLRPTYKLMINSSTIINSNVTSYNVPYEISDESQFMYMGVMPGPKIAVNKTLKFKTSFFCNKCLTRFRHTWVTDFCSVGVKTNQTRIHCQCNHLSFFSGIFIVPPHKIDPFDDFSLLLTIKDNPYIALYVVCISTVFLLLCVFAILKDFSQTAARQVIVLEDNFPGDKYFYIAAVFTGSRFLAGTEANVGIRIEGTGGRSRAHILKAKKHKVLKCNEDDWFLIGTSKLLGTITKVHIWHDNLGLSPAWYCKKILVYDMNSLTVYPFIVEEWIALGDKEFPQALIFPATADYFRNLGKIFFENLRHGIAHSHILASILSRHRDIKMTKLDKVIILWSLVMTASLIGIAFYKTGHDEHEGIEEAQYSIGTKTLIKGTQIFICNVFFISFFQLIFKMSYYLESPETYADYSMHERDKYKHKFENKYENSKEFVSPFQSYSVHLKPVKRSHMSSFEKFVQVIYKIYRPMKHMPVVLSRSSQVFKRKPLLYTLAWMTSLLAVILSSYFIILYGLKMGEVKGKDWMSNIIVALCNHFLVLVPVKIVLVACILASHFVNLVPISNYKIKIDDSLTVLLNQNTYEDVLNKRKSSKYHPLDIRTTCSMRIKMRKVILIWHKIIIIVVSSVFIGLLAAHSSSLFYFHTTRQTSAMVGHLNDHSYNIKAFIKVENWTQYLDFLLSTFITSDTLYRKFWYNGYSLSPSYLQEFTSWTEDCNYQVIGVPFIRQLRVIPNSYCTINPIFKDIIYECIPDWSIKVQDTDNYDYEWAEIQRQSSNPSTPWTYQTPEESETFYSESITGTNYPRGGYIAKLGTTRYQTNLALLRLIDGYWIDHHSTVIFCTLILYNVNTKSFTQVRLVAEHIRTGFFLSMINVKSVKLIDFEMQKSSLFIFIYVIALAIQTSIVLSRYGAKGFMTKLVSAYKVCFIFLGLSTVSFSVLHTYSSTAYISDFQPYVSVSVLNFYKLNKYMLIAHYLSILFFILLFIRVLIVWSFGRLILNTVSTLKGLIPTLIVLVIFLVVLSKTHWIIFNFLNLFSYLTKEDCLTKCTINLINQKCLEGSPANSIFFILFKISSVILLILTLRNFKLVKYKQDIQRQSLYLRDAISVDLYEDEEMKRKYTDLWKY